MGILKTKGIIIAESNMNDFDKMLTILTPNGKLGVLPKEQEDQKCAYGSNSILCFGEYMLYNNSQNYNINSCDIIEIFYNIRTDFEKLKYAALITKIINDVTDENQNTYKILQLFLNTLYMISETDKNLDLILSIFEIKLLCLLGFMPVIDKCVNCGEKEELKYFSLKDNGFKCSACGKQDKGAIEVSKTTENAIKYIVMAPAKKYFLLIFQKKI